MAQKKCPSCVAWNEANAEKCVHCGELIDRKKADYVRLKKAGKLPIKLEPSPLFEIKEHYPWYLKLLLYIVRPIYWTFFGIISFILYLVAWVAT
jgi:hypothetical protein